MLCMNSKLNSHWWMVAVSKETCWEGLLKILHHQVVIDFLFPSLLQPWISLSCSLRVSLWDYWQELEHFKISKNSHHHSSRESSWMVLPFRKYPNPKWSSNSFSPKLQPWILHLTHPWSVLIRFRVSEEPEYFKDAKIIPHLASRESASSSKKSNVRAVIYLSSP
jgi:hypothetical protein